MHYTAFLALVSLILFHHTTGQVIDPNSVNETTKETWCNSQKASCPLLCLQIPGATDAPRANNCSADSLSFSCVCSNGQQPNASEYSQTIPYFECTESANQCVNNCPSGDSACQTQCRTAHPCGAQSPKRINTSTISTMSATATGGSATSGSAVQTVFGAASTSSNGDSGAQAVAIGFGQSYGLAIILIGISAGFTLVL